MNNKKNIYFVILTYTISILIALLMSLTNNNSTKMFLYVILMLSPSIIATIMVGKEHIYNNWNIKFKNINRKEAIKYILIINIVIPFILMFYSYILSNILELRGVGSLILNTENLPSYIKEKMPNIFRNMNILIFSLIVFSINIFSSISINGLLGLGEEIGWRGFLEKNISSPFIKKNIIIGIIWGGWHIPIILLNGHNYSENRYLGCLMMIMLCISISFYFSHILKKSNSLLLMGVLHGSVNAFVPFLTIIHKNYVDILGPQGFLLMISFITVFVIDILINKWNEV